MYLSDRAPVNSKLTRLLMTFRTGLLLGWLAHSFKQSPVFPFRQNKDTPQNGFLRYGTCISNARNVEDTTCKQYREL